MGITMTKSTRLVLVIATFSLSGSDLSKSDDFKATKGKPFLKFEIYMLVFKNCPIVLPTRRRPFFSVNS